MMDKNRGRPRGPPAIFIKRNEIHFGIAHDQKTKYTLFEVDAGMNVEKML